MENVPFFLVAAFLYVLTEPSLLLARLLPYGYVVSRLLHFGAYFTALNVHYWGVISTDRRNTWLNTVLTLKR